MTVSSIGSFNSSNRSLQAALQAASDPAGEALKRAQTRTQLQLDSSTVKLSAFGQAKSAVAALDSASDNLAKAAQSGSSEELKSSAGAFVTAFNSAIKAAAAAGGASGDVRAQLTGNNLARALRNSNAASALSKAGITKNADGSLTLNSKTFDQALQAGPQTTRDTFGRVGTQVGAAATRELAPSSNMSSAVESLSKQVKALGSQLTQQQEFAAQQRQVQDLQANSLQGASANAIAAYLRAALL